MASDGNRNDRICIIGAGPGGLGACLALQNKGYKNITILESKPKAGGQSLSKTYHTKDGRDIVYELCSIQPLGSKNLNSIIKKYDMHYIDNIDIKYYSLTKKTLLFEKKFKSLFKLYLKKPWISLGLIKVLYYLFYFRDLAQPGLAHRRHSAELFVPFEDWLDTHNLHTFDYILRYIIFGIKCYNNPDVKIPTVYCWKFFLQCLRSPRRYVNGQVRPLKEGYQNLWIRASEDMIANGVRMVLNVHVKSITRGTDTIQVHVDGETLEFDRLIISCQKYADFLDCTPLELEIDAKVRHVTSVRGSFIAKNLPTDCGVVFLDCMLRLNDRQMLGFIPIAEVEPGHWLYTAAYLAPQDSSLQDIVSLTSEGLKFFDATLVTFLDMHKEPNYGTFFSHEDILNGVLEKSEQRQGIKNTWYVGETLSGGNHASVVDYAFELIDKHFP